MTDRVLNITPDDLPQPAPLIDVTPDETEQWAGDMAQLTQIAEEALALFVEATRRMDAAVIPPSTEEAAA